MVLIYLYDPSQKILPTPRQLQDYYGLTNAQAKVAVHLCSKDNIVGAAEHLGISVNTARSHLRTIYAKTGAKSQSELVGLLTSTIKTFDQNTREKATQ